MAWTARGKSDCIGIFYILGDRRRGIWLFIFYQNVLVLHRMVSSVDIYRELVKARTKLGRCYIWEANWRRTVIYKRHIREVFHNSFVVYFCKCAKYNECFLLPTFVFFKTSLPAGLRLTCVLISGKVFPGHGEEWRAESSNGRAHGPHVAQLSSADTGKASPSVHSCPQQIQAALWNRNRRNRNFLTSGTGIGTVTC